MTLSRGRLWTIAAASTACALGLVPLVAAADFTPQRALWIELDLIIGAGFTAVGLFAWYRRPDNRVGALMVATAFAWYLLVAGNTGSAFLWTLGTLLGNLFVATAIHLLLAFPGGRLETTLDRVLVGFAYLATTVAWLPVVLFTDPAAFGCTDCPSNLLLLDPDTSFGLSWRDGLSVFGIGLLLVVAARIAGRWRDATPVLRNAVAPVFLAGSVLMVALAAVLAVGLVDSLNDETGMNLFYGCLGAFGLVPYFFLAGLIKARWIRGHGLGALIDRLGHAPQGRKLRDELAEALGDPSLDLAFWLSDSRQYVDSQGRPVELPPGPGRAVTAVDRDGRRVAAIVHDPALLDDPELVRAAGAAAALALENERLDARLRAKVEELRASRSRLVEVGLSQRRRLERDLHDGAQQRLVSLALSLRLAQERIAGSPEEVERLLARSREELDEALKELRELARGIHPAVLSERGLPAAVQTLAHRAPVQVELGDLPSEQAPEHVELAAYFVVSEALTNIAKYASASRASVAVTKTNGVLTVEVSDDGVGGADMDRGSGLSGLAARLEAIEGRLQVESEPGRGTTVRARIPC